MRIVGLRCSCSPGEIVKPDHYHTGECKKPPMPLKWLRKGLKTLLTDSAHRAGNITASRLSACPRAVLIEDFIPCTPNLTDFNSMWWGSAIHQWIGDEPERMVGSLFGHKITGGPDEVETGLHDYKTSSESGHRFKADRGGVDPEVAVQVNVYRILREQNDLPPREMGVWNGAMTSAKAKVEPWYFKSVPVMTEDEIGALRPHGSGYTIRQHVEMLAGAVERITKGEKIEEVIKSVPLVGRLMWKGAKCENYCSVKRECDGIEGVTGL